MEAAEYAAVVAGVDEQAARDRGVPVERIHRMRGLMEVIQAGDPDAFYVWCCEQSSKGGHAVANLVRFRAESEADREPTNPNYVPPPGEVKGEP